MKRGVRTMSKLKQNIINVKVLVALVITAVLVVLILTTNSVALAFMSGTQNLVEQSNTDVNYQFGYGEPGENLPEGTTDIRGAATTDGRFIRDVDAASEDGQCSIHIPTGTIGLDKDLKPLTQLSIKPISPAPDPPEGNDIIGLPYDLGPSGSTFDPAITITFTYDPDKIKGDPKDLKLAIYVKNPTTGEYEWKVLKNIRVDPVNHTISGDTDEFTVFAIIALVPVVTTTTTQAQTTTPAQTSTTAAPALEATNWSLIGGLIAGAIVIVGLLVGILWWRRRSA
jgi:hypothetical protein